MSDLQHFEVSIDTPSNDCLCVCVLGSVRNIVDDEWRIHNSTSDAVMNYKSWWQHQKAIQPKLPQCAIKSHLQLNKSKPPSQVHDVKGTLL